MNRVVLVIFFALVFPFSGFSQTVSPATSGGSISGYVTFAGQPIVGAKVRANGRLGVTDANGYYKISGLKKNYRYRIYASKSTMRTIAAERGLLFLGETDLENINFLANCYNTNQRLINGFCQFPSYTLSGKITFEGRPLSGVRLRVGAKSAFTDAEGRYTLRGLRVGNYSIFLRKPYYVFTSTTGINAVRLTADTPNMDFAAACGRFYTNANGSCIRFQR